MSTACQLAWDKTCAVEYSGFGGGYFQIPPEVKMTLRCSWAVGSHSWHLFW